MAVDLASIVWSEIKSYIPTIDREEAAENLVSILIDNDYSAEEIRGAFKGDNDIKRALQSYLEYLGEEELDEENDDEDDEY